MTQRPTVDDLIVETGLLNPPEAGDSEYQVLSDIMDAVLEYTERRWRLPANASDTVYPAGFRVYELALGKRIWQDRQSRGGAAGVGELQFAVADVEVQKLEGTIMEPFQRFTGFA